MRSLLSSALFILMVTVSAASEVDNLVPSQLRSLQIQRLLERADLDQGEKIKLMSMVSDRIEFLSALKEPTTDEQGQLEVLGSFNLMFYFRMIIESQMDTFKSDPFYRVSTRAAELKSLSGSLDKLSACEKILHLDIPQRIPEPVSPDVEAQAKILAALEPLSPFIHVDSGRRDAGGLQVVAGAQVSGLHDFVLAFVGRLQCGGDRMEAAQYFLSASGEDGRVAMPRLAEILRLDNRIVMAFGWLVESSVVISTGADSWTLVRVANSSPDGYSAIGIRRSNDRLAISYALRHVAACPDIAWIPRQEETRAILHMLTKASQTLDRSADSEFKAIQPFIVPVPPQPERSDADQAWVAKYEILAVRHFLAKSKELSEGSIFCVGTDIAICGSPSYGMVKRDQDGAWRIDLSRLRIPKKE